MEAARVPPESEARVPHAAQPWMKEPTVKVRPVPMPKCHSKGSHLRSASLRSCFGNGESMRSIMFTNIQYIYIYIDMFDTQNL